MDISDDRPATRPGRARHIAVIAPPTPGHLNPLQAVGNALVAHGHRVTIVHVAGIERLVRDPAIGFAALGGPRDGSAILDAFLDSLARPTGVIGLNRMVAATAALSDLLLDTLPATLRSIGADALIADSAEPAGSLVARHLGLPYVTSITGLPLVREAEVPPPYLGWRYRSGRLGRVRNAGGYAVSDVVLRPINRTLARHATDWGLAPDDGMSPLLQVAQCPATLDFPRADLPAAFRYGAPWRSAEPPIDFPGDDARPLIFCSLGTLQGSRRALFASMTAACAMIGARAVVAHGGGLSDADAAGLPGDPLVRAFWPQTSLLPHCGAAILHGGFNTVLDTLAAGLPIVVVPIAFEQPATAARLERIGAGVVLRRQGMTARRLASALRRVLDDPAYAAAAGHIRDDLGRGDGAADAAAAISAAFAGAMPRAA